MPISTPLAPTDALIPMIYSGPLETPPWHRFLTALGERMGARNAALVLRLSRQGMPPLVLWGRRPTLNIDEARQIQAKHADLGHLDPLRNALDRPGAIRTLDEVIDRGALEKNSFYQQVLKPWGLEKQVGMYISEPAGWEGNVGVVNGRDDPDFDASDKAMLEGLRPHLELSLAIFARIKREESAVQALTDTLDRLTICALFLSGTGRILRANHAARCLLDAREVALSKDGYLELTHRAANLQMQELIARAFECPRDANARAFAEVMPLENSVHRHIGLLIRSLQPHGRACRDSAPAVVVYFAGSGQAQPIERLVTQLFDLTPSEAHLATLLATGSSLSEAAEKLGLTENTVRTYCKTILNKVGVRRQTELVRLILRSVAVLG